MIADFEVLTWDVAITTIFLPFYIWGCTLAPPGEYDRTLHVRRLCGLTTSNYFDHLFFMFVVMNPVCRRNKSMMTTMRRVLTSAALS